MSLRTRSIVRALALVGVVAGLAVFSVLSSESARAAAEATSESTDVVVVVESSDPTLLNTTPGDGPVSDYAVTPDSANAV